MKPSTPLPVESTNMQALPYNAYLGLGNGKILLYHGKKLYSIFLGKYGKFTLPTPEPRKYFPRAEDPMSLRRETRWDEFLGFWGSTCPKTAAHRQT